MIVLFSMFSVSTRSDDAEGVGFEDEGGGGEGRGRETQRTLSAQARLEPDEPPESASRRGSMRMEA